MKKVSALLIFCLLLIGCKKKVDCSLVLPPPNYFEITFVNSSEQSLMENIDSLRLYNSSFEKYIKPTPFASNDYLQIKYTEIKSGKTYYLDFNESGTDTLVCEFITEQTDCFEKYTMQKIKFNGQVQVVNNNMSFKLIK